MSDTSRLILPHGGYRKLRSFQVSELVYDGTVIFCDRFVDRRSRTHDQMVQAARSGVQNIAEGSVAAGTSKKTELKLTNVARASLEELKLDLEQFLRQHGLRQWEKDSSEARAVREKYKSVVSDNSDMPDVYGFRTASAEELANTLICLINQASYLLSRQLEVLEQEFKEEGGFTERLHAVRAEARAAHLPAAPACPLCGKSMRQRTARRGPQAGQSFWGCAAFPACNGTREIEAQKASDKSDKSDKSD